MKVHEFNKPNESFEEGFQHWNWPDGFPPGLWEKIEGFKHWNWSNGDAFWKITTDPISPVPDVSSLAAMVVGLVVLGMFLWRNRSHK